MYGALAAAHIASAASRSKNSNQSRGLTTSTGKYSAQIGLKPYVSDLTNEQIALKWASPYAKEKLLISHPIMNMIEQRTNEAVQAQMPALIEEESSRINKLTEAELKVIKKIYTPVTPILNRLKKGTQRAVGARTANNSRNELLEFAKSRHLPAKIREMREELTYQIKIAEIAKLSPREKSVYDEELEYQENLRKGYTRATTGPGSTEYTWIDDDEIASRMANSGISGWGGRRRRSKTRRTRK
jgi:hypothetical protein